MKPRSGRSVVPAELAAFNPEDWHGDVYMAFQQWTAGRAAWVAAGNPWPGGEGDRVGAEITVAAALPDEPWENVLARGAT